MNLNFTTNEAECYARLQAGIVEFRLLESEIEAGTHSLPALAETERAAATAVENFLPTQFIARGEDVLNAFTARRWAELFHAETKRAIHRCQSRLASLKTVMERDFRELQDGLRWKVRDAFPAPVRGAEKLNTNSGVLTPECAAAVSRVRTIEGDTIADRAEALLALAVEHGLKLPEVTA
jgi:hypothetical protein